MNLNFINNEKNGELDGENEKNEKNGELDGENKIYIYGFLIYIFIFAIIIPYIIYKLKWYFFLGVYFVNIDMLASVLSFDGGPFKSNVFKYLYNDPRTLIGYISYNIINLVVLLGIAYVIIKIAQEKKSIAYGMAVSMFIYIITYLFPTRFIDEYMNRFDKYLNHTFNIRDKYGHDFHWFIVCLFGLCIVSLFILCEKVSIKLFASHVAHFIEKIIFKL